MALEQTIWMKAIAEELFKDNEFLQESMDWSEYVQAGIKTVVVPQSGTASGVTRNRSSFPGTISERSDTDISYDMTDYTTDPRRVRDLEKVQLSYAKLQSVIRQDTAKIKEYMAEDIMYAWRAEDAARILRTTGDAVLASTPSATGNRKRIKLADLIEADKLLNDANIPKAGRVAVISSSMKRDLLLDPDIKGTQVALQLANYKSADVPQIANFKIYVRSTVLIYTNASTPVAKLPSAAGAATDNEAALCFHPFFVGRSVGNIKTFYNPNQADHYGDILSMEAQAGGRKFYNDGRGVVAIVQAASA